MHCVPIKKPNHVILFEKFIYSTSTYNTKHSNVIETQNKTLRYIDRSTEDSKHVIVYFSSAYTLVLTEVFTVGDILNLLF